ncbi:vWA domain-containing protein [Thermus oshimai]|uniref:vWA domain-containing protein n=1 Tax=Thermus oshimai TaxID=56957 RepID=UPI000363061D|nr:VWA domain-containing protein [Thermus oshimai]
MKLLAPEALSLLLLVGFLALALWKGPKKAPLPHPLARLLKEAAQEGKKPLRWLPQALFLLALFLLVLGAARPLLPLPGAVGDRVAILVIDVSRSMMAPDLKPNRLEAAKEAARAFLEEAPKGLRVGLVIFSGSAQTVHPPILDRKRLRASLESLEFGRSTAIGEGILEALRGIEAAGGKGVIVLLTDGRNRTGVDPLEAAGEAARMGVPIHAIGVGVPGWTPSPEDPVMGFGFFAGAFEVDEELLWAIGELTGGSHHLVTSTEALKALYRKLAAEMKLEVVRVEATGLFGLLGGFLALLSLGLRRFLFPL